MKKQEFPQDTLTMKHIRRDLQRQLWKSWAGLAFSGVLLALIVWLFRMMPAVIFEFQFWFCLILWLVIFGWQVSSVWYTLGGFRHKIYIVRDKLISADAGETISGRTYTKRAWCNLSFARYGDYAVPQKNHRWSKLYPMSCMGVYYHASEGDEFYLVLSKPHSGTILLAYNAKLFRLEGEEATDA